MPLSIREHVPLRDMTTFRVGGPARFFCSVTNEAELVEALDFARSKNPSGAKMSFFILGGGSNILVGDAGFDGLVIKMEIRKGDAELQETRRTMVTAGAGEIWDDFVETCVRRGFGGLENLSGIPGTVGAAPVQNIGAYGAEAAQTILSVRVFDASDRLFKNLSNAECRFSYRDSVFKHEKNADGTARYIIVSGTFALKKNLSAMPAATATNIAYKDLAEYFSKRSIISPDIAAVRQAVLDIRSAKLPDIRTIGTAGSFFKNPIISQAHFEKLKQQYPDMPSYPVSNKEIFVKVPLAWILDHVCGYKGLKKGSVGTYANQALVIVNDFDGIGENGRGATSTDIRNFAADMVGLVKEKTGIDIEPEVQYID